MPRRSAGILPYRQVDGKLQVLLVHPGGPFWRNRDNGAWSVSKGEYESDEEESEAAARREFTEETGWTADGPMIELDEIRQAGGKYLNIYAMEAAFDPATFVSNTFQMEWPPRSGRLRSFPVNLLSSTRFNRLLPSSMIEGSAGQYPGFHTPIAAFTRWRVSGRS
ncbi:MAG: NUDIX domain-containing protein [Alphaproteobacteria bacterium]|nr:MAG: NUDIX domain-containing protein [Alphaproteobacteria bacterium]